MGRHGGVAERDRLAVQQGLDVLHRRKARCLPGVVLRVAAVAVVRPHALLSPATLWASAALVATTMAYNYTSAVLYGQQSVAWANRMPVLYIAGFLLGAGMIVWIANISVPGLLTAATLGRTLALTYGLYRVRWP